MPARESVSAEKNGMIFMQRESFASGAAKAVAIDHFDSTTERPAQADLTPAA